MDRRRAGNPGRQVVIAGPTPVGRVIDETNLEAPDYGRAPRSYLQGMDGPMTARGRSAFGTSEDDRPMPNMNRSERWPEAPGKGTVRRLKKGGKVAAPKKKVTTKAKSLRRK